MLIQVTSEASVVVKVVRISLENVSDGLRIHSADVDTVVLVESRLHVRQNSFEISAEPTHTWISFSC